MSIEGELTVRLDWDGRRTRRAEVHSTRPIVGSRVVAGREACDAASLLPHLYSVCANAQGAAAAGALEAAAGRETGAAALAARDLAAALEALQEDLRRLAVDIPAAAGIPGDVTAVAQARKRIAPHLAGLRAALAFDAQLPAPSVATIAALASELAPLVEAAALGVAPDRYAAIDEAQGFVDAAREGATPIAQALRLLMDTAPRLGSSPVRTMPPANRASIEAAVLAALDADEGFALTPHWHGEAVETGALARHVDHPGVASFRARYGNGAAARLVARLVDVARTVVDLSEGRVASRVVAWSARTGEGVACVATARGMLLHRARVEHGRVTGYAVVAPTEWNFHPRGALVRGLAGLEAGDERTLARDADLVVQSLDPCVACRVEIARA